MQRLGIHPLYVTGRIFHSPNRLVGEMMIICYIVIAQTFLSFDLFIFLSTYFLLHEGSKEQTPLFSITKLNLLQDFDSRFITFCRSLFVPLFCQNVIALTFI